INRVANEPVRAARDQGVVLKDGCFVNQEGTQGRGRPNQNHSSTNSNQQAQEANEIPTGLELADSQEEQCRWQQPLDREQQGRDVPAPALRSGLSDQSISPSPQ